MNQGERRYRNKSGDEVITDLQGERTEQFNNEAKKTRKVYVLGAESDIDGLSLEQLR